MPSSAMPKFGAHRLSMRRSRHSLMAILCFVILALAAATGVTIATTEGEAGAASLSTPNWRDQSDRGDHACSVLDDGRPHAAVRLHRLQQFKLQYPRSAGCRLPL